MLRESRFQYGRHLRRVGLLLLLAALSGCSSTHTTAPVELTILHLNDLHARLLPDQEGLGGFAHVASILDKEQAAAELTLTVHAGDLVQGSPVSTLYQGLPIFEIANHLGIDVNCLGNHEFDYGWQKIPEFVERADFDTVCANVTNEQGDTIVPPYVIREVGPLRVAVIGAMTEHLLKVTTTEQLGPYRARAIVETLAPLVAKLREQTHLIVVLAHVFDEETLEILESLPDVTIVVQGHGHIAWDSALEVDGRLGVTSDGYGRAIGRLRLRYDADAKRILSYAWENLPIRALGERADPTVEELVATWESKASGIVDVTIGRSKEHLGWEEVRDLMERALIEKTGSDLAYLNLGGIRDTLPEGELLARHVWNVMPFDNGVVTIEIEGRRLVDMNDPTSGRRSVVDALEIDPRKTYRLATSDYLVGTWRDRGIDLKATDEKILLRDLFIEWIAEREVIP